MLFRSNLNIQMKKNELAREFLLENPKLPNRLAAKLLKQKYDAVFKDVDDARFMIRYVKGKAGKANQTKISASGKLGLGKS